MKDYFQSYKTTLDELNLLISASYQSEDNDIESRIQRISDDLLTFLIRAYQDGTESVKGMFDGDNEVEIDIQLMQDAIFEIIDGKTFEDRVRDHVMNSQEGMLQTLATSEYHRVFTKAEEDTAHQIADKYKLNLMKTWVTVADERVRDTHQYLEGQTIPIYARFYTYDGDSAYRPSGFSRVENNANCRCVLIYTTDTSQG